MTTEKLNKMRKASYLLPDPGGEVVRECLDEIEGLHAILCKVHTLAEWAEHTRKVQPDIDTDESAEAT